MCFSTKRHQSFKAINKRLQTLGKCRIFYFPLPSKQVGAGMNAMSLIGFLLFVFPRRRLLRLVSPDTRRWIVFKYRMKWKFIKHILHINTGRWGRNTQGTQGQEALGSRVSIVAATSDQRSLRDAFVCIHRCLFVCVCCRLHCIVLYVGVRRLRVQLRWVTWILLNSTWLYLLHYQLLSSSEVCIHRE